jgi:hypothetical protein
MEGVAVSLISQSELSNDQQNATKWSHGLRQFERILL